MLRTVNYAFPLVRRRLCTTIGECITSPQELRRSRRRRAWWTGRRWLAEPSRPTPAVAGAHRSCTSCQVPQRNPLGAMGGLIRPGTARDGAAGPVLAPYEPRQIIREAHKDPCMCCGIDTSLGYGPCGRDILSRIIHGAGISLYVGVGAVLIGVTGWFVVGMASAYAGEQQTSWCSGLWT